MKDHSHYAGDLRQAQLAALSLPNVGLSTAIDTGDWRNIHPPDKQTVAGRLVDQAMVQAYKQPANVSVWSFANLDGSRGGKGFHNHGGLTDATKNSPVVQEMREQVPPSTSSIKRVFESAESERRMMFIF